MSSGEVSHVLESHNGGGEGVPLSSRISTSSSSGQGKGDEAYGNQEKGLSYAEKLGAGEGLAGVTEVKPGFMTLEEDSAGGMGRHLGLWVCLFFAMWWNLQDWMALDGR